MESAAGEAANKKAQQIGQDGPEMERRTNGADTFPLQIGLAVDPLGGGKPSTARRVTLLVASEWIERGLVSPSDIDRPPTQPISRRHSTKQSRSLAAHPTFAGCFHRPCKSSHLLVPPVGFRGAGRKADRAGVRSSV
jgi:hypothetical protein